MHNLTLLPALRRLRALAWLVACATLADADKVYRLRREAWRETLHNRDWLLLFSLDTCPHCKRMLPMWKQLAADLPAAGAGHVNVGFVDCSNDNGIPRTYNIQKFPTVLYLTADGALHEFTGLRTYPELLRFAKGGFDGAESRAAPARLKESLEGTWLVLYTLWPPLLAAMRIAAPIAVAITVLLKLAAWRLRVYVERERAKPDRSGRAERTKKAG